MDTSVVSQMLESGQKNKAAEHDLSSDTPQPSTSYSATWRMKMRTQILKTHTKRWGKKREKATHGGQRLQKGIFPSLTDIPTSKTGQNIPIEDGAIKVDSKNRIPCESGSERRRYIAKKELVWQVFQIPSQDVLNTMHSLGE